MGFARELMEENIPIWQQCLETPFLRQLEDGTLSEDCFKGYIVDDSLYLREYAKVFAWGMTKAQTMDEIRAYYSLLAFVNESEASTRLMYLKRYGLQDSQIQILPLRPQNAAYGDCMIQAARDGEGAAECMMACLPCMVSYAWIFRTITGRTPAIRETVFWPLVADYVDDRYWAACQEWMDFADQVSRDLSPQRRERCRRIYRDCSLHELHFWEMSGSPRTDL